MVSASVSRTKFSAGNAGIIALTHSGYCVASIFRFYVHNGTPKDNDFRKNNSRNGPIVLCPIITQPGRFVKWLFLKIIFSITVVFAPKLGLNNHVQITF